MAFYGFITYSVWDFRLFTWCGHLRHWLPGTHRRRKIIAARRHRPDDLIIISLKTHQYWHTKFYTSTILGCKIGFILFPKPRCLLATTFRLRPTSYPRDMTKSLRRSDEESENFRNFNLQSGFYWKGLKFVNGSQSWFREFKQYRERASADLACFDWPTHHSCITRINLHILGSENINYWNVSRFYCK